MLPRIAILFLLAHSIAASESFDAVVTEIEKIQTEPGFTTATIGFCAIPLDAEDHSAAAGGHNMDAALIPASTMKVVTTATALEILGADYRFQTELQFTGSIAADGALQGNVIVKGGGDPTLGSSQIVNTFNRWQAALVEAGIKKIDGQIVGDESIFGTKPIPDSWQWNDMGNYYGAGACGLTFHQNQFFCRFQTGVVGAPAKLIGTDPRLPSIQFVNEMKTGSAGSG
ncbi:MAG: D-alanyl-D-alanine carboxypeptidase/D-alanyl-D-alanine-endopeptidase, partial [Verrucomicrobiota bacterium]